MGVGGVLKMVITYLKWEGRCRALSSGDDIARTPLYARPHAHDEMNQKETDPRLQSQDLLSPSVIV